MAVAVGFHQRFSRASSICCAVGRSLQTATAVTEPSQVVS